MRKEMEEERKRLHFEEEESKVRDALQKKQGEALLKAAGGSAKKAAKGSKKKKQMKPKSEDLEVDEMGTIHLIESLDSKSKKILNGLVQSVLLTQHENDKDKLSLLTQKRQIVEA